MKGVLRLEIEKHQIGHADLENISESGSVTNDSVDPGDRIVDSAFRKFPSNGSEGPQSSNSKWNLYGGKEISGTHENPDFSEEDVSIRPRFSNLCSNGKSPSGKICNHLIRIEMP